MIEIPVLNIKGEKVGSEKLGPAALGGNVRLDRLKQAVETYRAKQHQGTVTTKSRGMVHGSSKKLYRQKGTGRARAGNLRTPVRIEVRGRGGKPVAGASVVSGSAVALVVSLGPSASGLVLALGFDEASGLTAIDSSGRGLNGTIREAVRLPGKIGGALSFDGVNDWVTVADANALDLTTAMTLEAWVNPTAMSGWETVVLKERGPGALSYALQAHDGAPLAGGTAAPAAYARIGFIDQAVRGPGALPLGVWTTSTSRCGRTGSPRCGRAWPAAATPTGRPSTRSATASPRGRCSTPRWRPSGAQVSPRTSGITSVTASGWNPTSRRRSRRAMTRRSRPEWCCASRPRTTCWAGQA